MKFTNLFILVFLVSCSQVKTKNENLSKRIEQEETRSMTEIKSHLNNLIESHPELNESTKTEVSKLIKSTLTTHQT